MLDFKYILENAARVRTDAADKNDDCDIDAIVKLIETRRALIPTKENLRAEQRKLGQDVGPMKKKGEDTTAIETRLGAIKTEYKVLEQQEKDLTDKIDSLIARVPNIIQSTVPAGKSADDNVVRDSGGELPSNLPEKPKPHWEIGESLGILNLDAGAKTSGSGFYFYAGLGAKLERALVSWFLDEHEKAGYTEYSVPFLVSEKTLYNSGQLPKFIEQMYAVPEDGLFCIPTAEVPLTSLYADTIFDAADLPKKVTAYSACFRREAGAAGKDTRGVLRVHQFSKVELYHFELPERSYETLETMTGQAISLLKALGLKWRKLELCRGDLSFGAAKCYDLEVFSPGVGRWLEVSSCSNCETFQARRAGIRYKTADKKNEFIHTLNGSGLATPRIIVALLETFQQADGSVLIPPVLRPYLGGRERIEKK